MQRLSTRVFVAFAALALVLSALIVPQPTSANPVGGSARFQLDPSLVNSDAFTEFVPAVLPIGLNPSAVVRVVVRPGTQHDAEGQGRVRIRVLDGRRLLAAGITDVHPSRRRDRKVDRGAERE